MIHEKDVRIPVRDGARLGARIWRPEGAGKHPALLAVSPYRYDNDEAPAIPVFLWRETGPVEWYVDEGYAYVHVDVRGTGISEGVFKFMDTAEQHDLYNIVEWIARQPWSNGKVGGIGQSYYCMLQWFLGIENPPHLACLGAYDGLNDPYGYMGYPGGIEGNFLSYWFNSSVRVPNLYPANGDNPRELEHDVFLDVERHPFYDDFWRERSALERLDRIKAPLFSVGVWAKQDLHLFGNIMGWKKAQGPKKLAFTDTPTAFSSMQDFASVEFHKKWLAPFYAKFLKGERTSWDERPDVEYIVRGTGEARATNDWPPPGVTATSYYLAPGPTGSVTSLNDGALAPAAPGAAGGSTTYAYPQASWVLGVVAMGPMGPDPVRAVLTFTGPPLPDDLEIAGAGKLVVHLSTTKRDADVVCKVSEQLPQSADDRAKGLQPRYTIATKGWHRASHTDRDPRFDTPDTPYYTHERSTPLEPGKIYELEIPLLPIAYRFKKGSRIRVEIACGDSPVTDSLFTHIYRPDKMGADTIHHDAAHPSRLVLPVLPKG